MSAEIPRREILRYLGNANASEQLDQMINSVWRELLQAARPRSAIRRVALRVGQGAVETDGFLFYSRDLSQSLAGCESGYFLAATLGAQADMLLRRFMAVDLPRAAILQAACAAMLEIFLDDLCGKLARKERKNGLFLLPRFSPGYRDWDLRDQEKIFQLLDLPRRLGLSLTDGYMMLPEKSVTALAGLSMKTDCILNSCELCSKTDCGFRRS